VAPVWSKREFHPPPPPPVPDDTARLIAAQQESTEALIQACHRGPEVRRVVSEFRGMRERNGFGTLLTQSMRLR
jgi:hypothetical protein